MTRFFQKLLAKLGRPSAFSWRYRQPAILNIFTTDRCNFSCSYCSRSLKSDSASNLHHYTDRSAFGLADLVFLLEKYPRLAAVSFVGIGEPFLNADLLPMALLAKSLGKQVSVITNASLLHRHWGAIAPNFDEISISLHGFSADELRRVAGVRPGTYEQLVENVRYLLQTEKLLNPRLTVRASVVVLKDEVERVREAAAFCQVLGLPVLDLQNHLPYDLAATAQCLFDDDTAALAAIDQVCQEFAGVVQINPLTPLKRNPAALNWGCQSFFQTLRVDGLGQVSGCARMMVPKKEHGNFREDPDVWHNAYFTAMRRKFRRRQGLPESCRYCPESQ